MDATRGGPRARAPRTEPALRRPRGPAAAGAGASDGDDGDDAVRRRHGVVDGRPGGSPSSTKDEKKDAGKEPGAGA